MAATLAGLALNPVVVALVATSVISDWSADASGSYNPFFIMGAGLFVVGTRYCAVSGYSSPATT